MLPTTELIILPFNSWRIVSSNYQERHHSVENLLPFNQDGQFRYPHATRTPSECSWCCRPESFPVRSWRIARKVSFALYISFLPHIPRLVLEIERSRLPGRWCPFSLGVREHSLQCSHQGMRWVGVVDSPWYNHLLVSNTVESRVMIISLLIFLCRFNLTVCSPFIETYF